MGAIINQECFLQISSDQSITAVVLQILHTLVDLVQTEDEEM